MDMLANISGLVALASIIATLGYLAYAADGGGDGSRSTIGDSQPR